MIDKNLKLENLSYEELLEIMKKEQQQHKEMKPRDDIIHDAIDYFFEHYEIPSDLRSLKVKLINFINKQIELDNAAFNRKSLYAPVKELETSELVWILPYIDDYRIVKRSVHATAESSDLMYQTEHGWYAPARMRIQYLANIFCRKFNIKETENIIGRIKAVLNFHEESECNDEDYTPLLNGVFNKEYWDEHHELLPYSKDRIFINPFNVKFNPEATNPEIDIDGTKFNVEDWLSQLAANDEDIKNTLWDVLSGILHPYRKYGKALMVYSPVGNNGKGTFLELCRNVVGPELCSNLSIESFADKNLVVNIANSRLVAGDENAVNQYIDNSENFKNAVTGDPITVDRKYTNSLTFSYSGFIIQCMNGLPTTKDKSNSFYRRLIVLPFNSNFEGKENKAIKKIYMKNKDVLEYVVHKALMLDVEKIETPDAANLLMEEFKEDNDSLLQWWKDQGSQENFVWDRLPWCLLYGSYDFWYRDTHRSEKCNISQPKFTREFKQKILPTLDNWDVPDNKDGDFVFTTEMKNTPEPLIGLYNVKQLLNEQARGNNRDDLAGSYSYKWDKHFRGIVKIQ